MLFKLRNVRRSERFSSRMRSTTRQRREYAATIMTMAIVQGVMAVALLIAGIRSWQAVSSHGNDLPLVMKLALPVVFTAGALLAVRSCFRNVQAAREIRATPRAVDMDDAESG